MLQNTSKGFKKGFIYTDNSYLLICQLSQNSLLLIVIPENSKDKDKDHNIYYKKQYYNQFFTKDSFSMFETYLDFYQALDISRQNGSISLTNCSFSIELQVFRKTIIKSFQLQKFKLPLQLKYIIHAKQLLIKQKDKQSASLTNNTFQYQNQAQNGYSEKLQKLQKQLNKKNQQILTMKKQIKQLILIVQQKKSQLKNLKQESDSQEDIFQFSDKKETKQIKKLSKLNQIKNIEQQKQLSEKKNSFKQSLNDFVRSFLKQKFKQIKTQIETHNQQHKLTLTQKLIDYSIDFSHSISFYFHSIKIMKQCNLTNIQILILQNNNICDIGWKSFLAINLPKLKVLSVGNNNLKNIQFNKQISKLQKIYLADNQKIYKFFNILSRQTLHELLKYQWENIKFLSITFRKYCDIHQKELEEDNQIWTQFINNKFYHFPALKVLHVGNIDLKQQITENLQKLCSQKRVKLQKFRKDLI